ncbi:sigma-70 RNA polymerase sigma factor region 4 domain-containing protein [Microvirga rosea]|uniref:sigma factor n=1 Tax=Microvirga rosea TaxID=2715425 RepID=UPI001D09EBDC|nr:sigma factor [Microvirga rosea]MCB8823293.1 sigma-70 family RNA polymerase sigma factor [Microvirga rosea]
MQSYNVNRNEEADEATAAIAHAIQALPEEDLLRLKALARLRARSLPGVEWADVLNETIVRALRGTRRWSPGVPIISFLAWSMRSVCDEYWRKMRRERTVLVSLEGTGASWTVEQADEAPDADPERTAAAVQMLAILDALFAEDEIALKIIAGLGDGLSAAEIRVRYGLSETDYDSARKRMRRTLLRHNLRGWER